MHKCFHFEQNTASPVLIMVDVSKFPPPLMSLPSTCTTLPQSVSAHMKPIPPARLPDTWTKYGVQLFSPHAREDQGQRVVTSYVCAGAPYAQPET